MMTTQESTSSHKEMNISDLLEAEYISLREEIIKRIEIQHQMLSIALIAPGTILAIGFQTSNASLMLLYPVLGLFLSAIWLANSFAIHDIAAFIISEIQPRVNEGRSIWEHFRASSDTRHLGLLHFWGARGLFIGTELLALFVGITLAKFETTQILFLIIGIASSLLTIVMLLLRQWKNQK